MSSIETTTNLGFGGPSLLGLLLAVVSSLLLCRCFLLGFLVLFVIPVLLWFSGRVRDVLVGNFTGFVSFGNPLLVFVVQLVIAIELRKVREILFDGGKDFFGNTAPVPPSTADRISQIP